MPKENDLNKLAFNELSAFHQGCIDCILDCESKGDHAADWQGVGREDFLPDTLRRIVANCGQFISTVSGNNLDFADQLFGDVDEYDLGWHYHLERQGTGVGFAELHISQPLLSRLQMTAATLGEMHFAIGDDQQVHLVGESAPAPLDYDSLTSFQEGFADCLVELESEGEFEDEWDGVDVHDFSAASLKIIVEDCDAFITAIVGGDRAEWDTLFPGLSDHDLGWYLCLERQGAGVGFRDKLAKGDLVHRMVQAADDLGSLSVEVGDDGQIHVTRQARWHATPTS